MDTLTSMRVFRQVVELGSFVAAAQRLQMSTAMTSKHVMHLERRLHARLLNRSSRHLSLTEAGTVYFDQCRDMLDSLDEVESTLGRAAVVARGVLKISAPAWFANRTFTRLLAAYQQQYPEVQLDIDLSGRVVNLVEEGFDLALRVTQAPAQTLIARPICAVKFHLVAAPSYLQNKTVPTQAAELSQHSMISYSLTAVSDAITLDGPNGRETVKLRSVLKANNESLMRHAALAGMGLAFLPAWLVDEDVEAGYLQKLLPDWGMPTGKLYAVYASRRYLSSKVRTFLDFISEDGRLA